MLMVCIYMCVRAHTYIYIRRGLRCCCLDTKAIPEPLLAEQQDCSPAFSYVYAPISDVQDAREMVAEMEGKKKIKIAQPQGLKARQKDL